MTVMSSTQLLRGLTGPAHLLADLPIPCLLSTGLLDKTIDGCNRPLLAHELLVLSLNQLAARAKRGFFYHIRDRRGWRGRKESPMCPADRQRGMP